MRTKAWDHLRGKPVLEFRTAKITLFTVWKTKPKHLIMCEQQMSRKPNTIGAASLRQKADCERKSGLLGFAVVS